MVTAVWKLVAFLSGSTSIGRHPPARLMINSEMPMKVDLTLGGTSSTRVAKTTPNQVSEVMIPIKRGINEYGGSANMTPSENGKDKSCVAASTRTLEERPNRLTSLSETTPPTMQPIIPPLIEIPKSHQFASNSG